MSTGIYIKEFHFFRNNETLMYIYYIEEKRCSSAITNAVSYVYNFLKGRNVSTFMLNTCYDIISEVIEDLQ